MQAGRRRIFAIAKRAKAPSGVAISTAAQFEQSMANAASVSSAKSEEFEEMTALAREMETATGQQWQDKDGGAIVSTTQPAGKDNAIWINPSTGVIKYWKQAPWASTYGVFA